MPRRLQFTFSPTWYRGSAVDQSTPARGRLLAARVRARLVGQPSPDAVFDLIPVTEQFASNPGTTDLACAPRNNTVYRARQLYEGLGQEHSLQCDGHVRDRVAQHEAWLAGSIPAVE